MTRGQRLTFLGIAAAIAVVAVIVLASGGGETDGAAKSARTPSPGATSTAAGSDATATPTPTPKPAPLLQAGQVKALTAHQGDTVRFRVRSDEKEEVHVHGYDIKKDLEPGETVDVAFKASITGIFEIELEGPGTQLASLKVLP